MIQWVVGVGAFRNANHAIWFFCTLAIFISILVQRLLPRGVWSIPVTGVIVHLSPIVNATRVAVRHQTSDLYTPDCIVYNSVMISAYIATFLLLRKRERRKAREPAGGPRTAL
jgi:hypothetical protein